MTRFARADLIDIQSEIWDSILVLCNGLQLTDWEKQTNCPTWTVKDCLSHLIGVESRLLGLPVPEIEIEKLEHVKNSQGLDNELDIMSRRSKPPRDIVREFVAVTGLRIDYLRNEKDFSVKVESPVGMGSLADQVSVRIFDCWIHQQDIKMAIGAKCDFVSAAANLSFDRMYSVMPFVVGKKVAPINGTKILFEIHCDEKVVQKAVHVSDNKASFSSDSVDHDVSIVCTDELFFLLTCGRISPEKAIRDGSVEFRGDKLLGERVASNMNFMI